MGTQGCQASGGCLPWCSQPAGCAVLLVRALPRPPALPRHSEQTPGQCHEGQHIPVVVLGLSRLEGGGQLARGGVEGCIGLGTGSSGSSWPGPGLAVTRQKWGV